jgi:hypothetical protein
MVTGNFDYFFRISSFMSFTPYRIAFFGFILAVFSGLGCRKNEGPGAGYDLLFRQFIEVPVGIGVFQVHHFYIENIPTNFFGTLASGGRDSSEVEKVLTLEGTLAGQFSDVDLRFIRSVSVRVYTDSSNDFLEIAYNDPAPVNPGNRLILYPSLADSKDFFAQERVNIDVAIQVNRVTEDNYPLQLDLTMRAVLK